MILFYNQQFLSLPQPITNYFWLHKILSVYPEYLSDFLIIISEHELAFDIAKKHFIGVVRFALLINQIFFETGLG